MKTFCIQTLGCKVNAYESEQLATLLRRRGLTQASAEQADLRVVHTCSVTMQAASQSRQAVRRMVRLPIFTQTPPEAISILGEPNASSEPTSSQPEPARNEPGQPIRRSRVIVTGCWATSDAAQAAAMAGVDAVLTHHQDVALELDRLLTLWREQPPHGPPMTAPDQSLVTTSLQNRGNENAGMIPAAAPIRQITQNIRPNSHVDVNQNSSSLETQSDQEKHAAKEGWEGWENGRANTAPSRTGITSLPQLDSRQTGRQRAFLKIQDGCDAHCTYCIIPTLRPRLWSKPIDAAVDEAKALTEAGHVEIVLTGIFLGAYGQPTALRRRQGQSTGAHLARLIDALCTRVPALSRLRLSSLEPGDLTDDLLSVLRSHRQIVPHFHLPLQSGSDVLLRRMNRQYTRTDFLRMVDRVRAAYDRPALTTDVVVGFPGETPEEFTPTADAVRSAGFIHVHAFPYSPRPGTAAARWTSQFVRGPVVNERIEQLRAMAAEQSLAYRQSFIGQSVDVIIERDSAEFSRTADPDVHHGRCERYFSVRVKALAAKPGDSLRAKIVQVSGEQTMGELTRAVSRLENPGQQLVR